jgi:hypothetical protein
LTFIAVRVAMTQRSVSTLPKDAETALDQQSDRESAILFDYCNICSTLFSELASEQLSDRQII